MRSKYVLQNDKKSHVDYIVFIFFVRTEKWCKSIWANYQCTGALVHRCTGSSENWSEHLETVPRTWCLVPRKNIILCLFPIFGIRNYLISSGSGTKSKYQEIWGRVPPCYLLRDIAQKVRRRDTIPRFAQLNIKKTPPALSPAGLFVVFSVKAYRPLMLEAWGPLGPSVTSKDTR